MPLVRITSTVSVKAGAYVVWGRHGKSSSCTRYKINIYRTLVGPVLPNASEMQTAAKYDNEELRTMNYESLEGSKNGILYIKWLTFLFLSAFQLKGDSYSHCTDSIHDIRVYDSNARA